MTFLFVQRVIFLDQRINILFPLFLEADLGPVPAAVAGLGGAEEAGAGDGGHGLGPHHPLLQPPGGHLQVTLPSLGSADVLDKVSCEM